LDSAAIAGVECMGLLSDHLAISKAYAYLKRKEIKKERDVWKVVCFIDLGYSSFSISFVEFCAKKGKVLFTYSDRNIGARNMDKNMLKYLSQVYKE